MDVVGMSHVDALLPMSLYEQLWQDVGRVNGALSVGARVGQQIPLNALGVVGYAMRHAPTVGAALALLRRCGRAVIDGAVPQLTLVDEQVRLTFTLPAGLTGMAPAAVAHMTAALAWLERLCGQRCVPQRVELAAAVNDDAAELEVVFGAPVCFNADGYQLVFSREVLDRVCCEADERLCRYLTELADRQLAQLPANDPLADVLRVIEDNLNLGAVPRKLVAKRMGMSERTLQRRLRAQGTSFQALTERTRERLARQYLAMSDMPIYTVAEQLGYADASSFHRAFRRWSGHAPVEFRRLATRKQALTLVSTAA